MRTASFFHYRACPAKREPSLSASGPEGPPVAGGEGGEVRFLKGDERRSVQSTPQKEALRMRSETRTAPSVQSSPQKGKLFPPHVPRFRQKPPGRFLPAPVASLFLRPSLPGGPKWKNDFAEKGKIMERTGPACRRGKGTGGNDPDAPGLSVGTGQP